MIIGIKWRVGLRSLRGKKNRRRRGSKKGTISKSVYNWVSEVKSALFNSSLDDGDDYHDGDACVHIEVYKGGKVVGWKGKK